MYCAKSCIERLKFSPHEGNRIDLSISGDKFTTKRGIDALTARVQTLLSRLKRAALNTHCLVTFILRYVSLYFKVMLCYISYVTIQVSSHISLRCLLLLPVSILCIIMHQRPACLKECTGWTKNRTVSRSL